MFYKKLFEERLQKGTKKLLEFLKDILVPPLTMAQKKICEDELTEKEIGESLIDMENNKSDDDCVTREFCRTFWNEIKNISINSLRKYIIVILQNILGELDKEIQSLLVFLFSF